jgi:hypothetical protein
MKNEIWAREIQWTVTDMDVSTDESQLIYSSITPTVHLVDLETLNARYERIRFTQQNQEDDHD